jgi:hypothetical protein
LNFTGIICDDFSFAGKPRYRRITDHDYSVSGDVAYNEGLLGWMKLCDQMSLHHSFKIAAMLVRVNQIANVIIHADHSIM